MRRKLLALFLVLCLVLPLIPAVTQAEDETYEVTDRLTCDLINTPESLFRAWSDVHSQSNAVYAGNSECKNETIHMKSAGSNSGIVTTASGGKAKRITASWNENTTANKALYVYGSATPFSAPNELYTDEAQAKLLGSIVYEETEELDIVGDYEYIGLRSKSGDIYLDVIEITWEIESAPVTPSPTAEPTATPEPSPTAEPNDSKTYVLVTEEKELASGSTYLIASSGESGEAYVMSKQNVNTRSAYEVTVSDDSTIVLNTSEIASSNNDSTAFELKLEGSTDAWALFDPINGYLYSTDNGDYLKSSPEQTCTFTIRYNSGSVAAMISSMNGTEHDDLQFNDNNKVFSCYEREKQPVYLYKLVDGTEPPADKPEIESWSVVLSGQIGMNFYMTIPEGYQPDTMKITIGSREVTAKGVKQDDGRYKFTCYLTSVEMAEQITAVYTYEVDGTEARESKTTSIQGYLNEIIVNIDHKEEYEKAKALAKALLNYGYYAQKAVADGVNHPETDETYIGEANLPTEITGYVTEPTLDSSIITGVTYSLSLDTETALNIYLTTADGCVLSKDNVVISATGADVKYSVDKVGSRYRVKITGIGAHELGTVITVTTGNSTIQASALTYVQKCLVNDKVKQATKNAAAALYRYYQEAIIYAGGAEG